MNWYVIINSEYSGQPATRYLTGFAGSTSVLLLHANTYSDSSEKHSQILKNLRMLCGGYLLLDSRYWELEQALNKRSGQVAKIDVVRVSREYTAKQAIEEIVSKEKIKKITIDGTITSHSSFLKLQEYGVELVTENNVFEKMRSVKSQSEQKLVKKAIKIAADAFERVRPYIVVGAKESDIAARLEYEMKLGGAEKAAFDTIVASGLHSAVPHAQTSTKKIEKIDSVIIDFGCFYEGYASDLTKTILMPDAPQKIRDIYYIVENAHTVGVAAISSGMKASSLDETARKVVAAAGYSANFLHSTGHGVGMSVHESPHIGATSEDVLEKGNVITIEPGIYLPGLGGVRIETTEMVR